MGGGLGKMQKEIFFAFFCNFPLRKVVAEVEAVDFVFFTLFPGARGMSIMALLKDIL